MTDHSINFDEYCNENHIHAMRQAFYHHVMSLSELAELTNEQLDQAWIKFLKDTLDKWNKKQ